MNVVLVDYNVEKDWDFIKVLESTSADTWVVEKCISNQYHGSIKSIIIRFLLYFIFPFFIMLKRLKYERIIAWQQFYGLNFAFWSRLLHLKKVNDLTIMTFIYKKKRGFLGIIYHKYMCYIVKSKYIDRFICFSKEECDYYPELFGVPRNRFIYVTVGIEPINTVDIKDEGYIFATGRSNRDYDFLLSVLNGTDYKCQIVCDTLSKKISGRRISVLTDCHGNEMIKRMAHSHCVVIPLKDIHVSSGQLVILQAMALGKPVICTDADGIRDYTSTDTTIMIPNDVDKWKKALNLLYNDEQLYNKLSDSSYDFYEKNFTDIVMYRNIANIINTDKYEKDN